MFGAELMWGLMAPVGKFVLSGALLSPLVLTDCRMFGAALLFWIVSFFTKQEHVNHKDMLSLFFASMLGIVFNQGSYIFGLSMTSPINASIVTTSSPILTMIIAALYLREPVTGKKLIGVFMGATGALLLIFSGQQMQNAIQLEKVKSKIAAQNKADSKKEPQELQPHTETSYKPQIKIKENLQNLRYGSDTFDRR